MNSEFSFETIPFEIDPEFQGEMFEEDVELERGRSFTRGAGKSFQPRPQPRLQPQKTKRFPTPRPILRGYGRPWESNPNEPNPSASEYVRWVQNGLNQAMGLQLSVTGIMNPETRSAVRNFQKQKGLPVSGIVGPDTEKALLDAVPSTESVQNGDEVYEFETLELESSVNMPTLRKGSRGAAVADLQRRLTAAGFNSGAPDGDFGSITLAAVKSFQRSRGITVDGIVGSQTWGQLYAQPTKPTPITPSKPACTAIWSPVMLTTLRSNIVITAVGERLRWKNGVLKEVDAAARNILIDYWKTGLGMTQSKAENFTDNRYAWSAAFICWVLRKAGAGADFKYNSYHSTYIAAAYQNRMSGNCSPFKAYRIHEAAPQLGDLVCTTYEKGVTTDLARVQPNTGGYHCDIVVKVEPRKLTTLGGNVSDSVGQKTITTDANGFVNNSKYFAVIKIG